MLSDLYSICIFYFRKLYTSGVHALYNSIFATGRQSYSFSISLCLLFFFFSCHLQLDDKADEGDGVSILSLAIVLLPWAGMQLVALMSCLLLQLHLFDSVCSGKPTNLLPFLALLSKKERENKDERFTAC